MLLYSFLLTTLLCMLAINAYYSIYVQYCTDMIVVCNICNNYIVCSLCTIIIIHYNVSSNLTIMFACLCAQSRLV